MFDRLGWLRMNEFLTTREVAALLRIKERKVYDLAGSGQLPCNKAMGKLLFPRAEIEAWLANSGSGGNSVTLRDRPNVLLGSHDPLLEWAMRESGSGLAAYFDGSGDGIERFDAGEGIAAGLHLLDCGTAEWNVRPVRERFAGQPVVLVEWAKRTRGLVLAAGNPYQVQSLTDAVRLRFADRQSGAGAQRLFEQLCEEAKITPGQVEVTATLRTETDAALAILEGKADFSFGLDALASQYSLSFVPLIEERYDLLIDRRAWFEPPMQTLWNFCRSDVFLSRAAEMKGYNMRNFGRVHFNGR